MAQYDNFSSSLDFRSNIDTIIEDAKRFFSSICSAFSIVYMWNETVPFSWVTLRYGIKSYSAYSENVLFSTAGLPWYLFFWSSSMLCLHLAVMFPACWLLAWGEESKWNIYKAILFRLVWILNGLLYLKLLYSISTQNEGYCQWRS